MSKHLFKTSILKDVILGEKLYNKLFHRKDKAPFFETIDTVWGEPTEPIDNWVVDDVKEWVEPEINSFSEPIDNWGVVDAEEWNQNNSFSEPIDNWGVVDTEEWNQNEHNIFQNLSEEKRLAILKLFATKD